MGKITNYIFITLLFLAVCFTITQEVQAFDTNLEIESVETPEDDYYEDLFHGIEFVISGIILTLFLGFIPLVCMILCLIFYKRSKNTIYNMPLKIMMSSAGISIVSFIIICIYTHTYF